MAQRSQKLDEEEFREKRSIPGVTRAPLSALNILLDHKSAFAVLEASKLTAITGQPLQEFIDELKLPSDPIPRFNKNYPEAVFLDLATLQDPDDIAELDAVADELNVILSQRNATREALAALQIRVDAVYAKYTDSEGSVRK